MPADFSFASTPHIHFGAGKRSLLPQLVAQYGSRLLLVTGGHSFDHSPHSTALLDALAPFEVRRLRVGDEPSPQLVDRAVAEHRPFAPHCVVAVGGGSAVDAAKAVAGLLPGGASVFDYLEGVGKGKAYRGPATPFIALPTTAGTGGETSKNAVLSEIGENGFKKSFRHELLVARHIILDPELTLTCPPEITAACGMDAFTQLVESYVSSGASPMTDALALSGLRCVRDGLLRAVEAGDDIEARANMLYASSISGITLANAGLGSVHGLASPLGAFFPIPHGVVCGSLLAEASRLNMALMRRREPENRALGRYVDIGRLMLNAPSLDDEAASDGLLALLDDWSERLKMPRLSPFGVRESDIERIVVGSRGHSMQSNPIRLTDEEIAALLRSRL